MQLTVPTALEAECRTLGVDVTAVDVLGCRMAVAQAGEGPVILAVHGFGTCFYSWRVLFQDLAGEYRIVAPDMPGFGLSGDWPEGRYGLPAFSEAVVALMDKMDIERAVLCGHSFGALVCRDVAALCPERVEKLVLVSPPTPGGNVFKKPLMLYAYSELSGIDPSLFAVYRAVNARTPEPLSRMTTLPFPREGGTPGMPTLIVRGEKDAVTPSGRDEADACPPECVRVLVPGAGHCPHEEQRELFTAELKAFLGERG